MPRTISRRQWIQGALGLAAVSLAGRAQAAQPKSRPNFIFILVDDQAWNAMGHTARFPFLDTPNMDRLAREGASFENAFVTISLCSPSRACFLTGCHAHHHNVRTNEKRDPDPDVPIFPALLQEAGYQTAFVGKWHMAPTAMPRPGFDYWLSFKGQGTYADPKLNENGRDFTAKGYMTDLLTDYAVQWLEKPREEPFCLLLWHKAVHGPFTPAERHADAFPGAQLPKPPNFDDDFADKPAWFRRAKAFGLRRDPYNKNKDKEPPASIPPEPWRGGHDSQRDYLRALLAVDESVGRVRATLEKQGQLDNTVFIFSSDNGFFLGEHRLGDKRLMYEESLRVPLLVRYPGLVEPGSQPTPMALNIDIGPTILDLAGTPIPPSMHGRTLKPVLAGEDTDWRKSFFYAYYQEGWLPGYPTIFGVRTERWKYITCPKVEGDIDELYDLENDPYELHNLSTNSAHADKLEEMRTELERLLAETGYQDEPPPKPAKVPSALALSYAFAEAQDGKVKDHSPNGIDGVIHNGHTDSAGLHLDGKGSVEVGQGAPLDPSNKPLLVGGWCCPEAGEGVLVSLGGQTHGFSLYLDKGVPHFVLTGGNIQTVASGTKAVSAGQRIHLAGCLTAGGRLQVLVNGKVAGDVQVQSLIPVKPNEGCTVGADLGTPAGAYARGTAWKGTIQSIRLYWGEPDQAALQAWLQE